MEPGRPSSIVAYERVDEKALPAERFGGCCTSKCAAVTLGITFIIEAVLIASLYHCNHIATPAVTQTESLVTRQLGGNRFFKASNLPGKRSAALFSECGQKVVNKTVRGNLVFGYAAAPEAVDLLYKCSKVPGLFENVPYPLRGVFWMKGNPIPEELAVLQMGQWFPEERTYVVPFAPFMWGWTEGHPDPEPSALPFGVYKMYGAKIARRASALAKKRYTLSFKFGECPGGPWLPWPFGKEGQACNAGDGADTYLKYATIQEHPRGDLLNNTQESHYTLEEMPGYEAGNMWNRGIYGGPPWMGQCKCVSMGAYNLVKILDAEGNKIEPYYTEFVKYMGEVPLFMWSGVAGKQASPQRREAARKAALAEARAQAAKLKDHAEDSEKDEDEDEERGGAKEVHESDTHRASDSSSEKARAHKGAKAEKEEEEENEEAKQKDA